MKSSSKIFIGKKRKSENSKWRCYYCKRVVGQFEYRIKNQATNLHPMYVWMCSPECAELWILKNDT
jgi:hypothetical protein